MPNNISDMYVLAQGPKDGIHRFLISCTITDTDGNVFDLTGDNAIVFPDILTEMTVKQRRNFVKILANTLIDFKLNPNSIDNFN